MRPRLLLTSLVLALAAGGCSGAGSDAPASETPRVITDVSEVSLPLDSYRPRPGEYTTIRKALDTVTARCLRKFGIQGRPIPPSAYKLAEKQETWWWKERGGLTKLQDAQRWGYHASDLAKMTDEKVPHVGDGLSNPEEDVLYGQTDRYRGKPVPKDGCNGEAARMLRADQRSGGSFGLRNRTLELAMQASHAATADPQYTEMIDSWSSCMKETGYRYSSPEEAQEDARWGIGEGGQPNQAERAAAVADVKCKRRVNYLGVWEAVHKKHEQRLVEKHHAELTEGRKVFKAELKNAVKVAGSPGR